jgi:hypothetical protein
MAYPVTNTADFEESSSQYLSITDASQTGLDITGDFTFEAWVKLESFTGSNMMIIAKKITTGYQFLVNSSSNKLQINYLGTGGSNTVISCNTAFTAGDIGVWRHVAITVDVSARTASFYIDGVDAGSTTDTAGDTDILGNTDPFEIGAKTGASTFDGRIGLVRVWSDIRTQSEIVDNACVAFGAAETNMEGEWSLNNVLTDASGNGNTLTNNNTVTFGADVPGFCLITDLTTDLVSYWKLDETSGSAIDSVGSNAGSNSNVTYAAAKINNGGVFNGSNAALNCSTSSTLNPSGSFSFNLWFNSNDVTDNNAMFTRDNGGAVGTDRSYGMYTSGSNLIGELFSSGNVYIITGGTTLLNNTWYMATFVQRSGAAEFEIYLNGVSDATAVASNATTFTSTHATQIGRKVQAGNPKWWNGELDEVGFWNKALSGAEITELYNSGAGNQYPFSGGVSINSNFFMFM